LRRFAAKNFQTAENDREKFSAFDRVPFPEANAVGVVPNGLV